MLIKVESNETKSGQAKEMNESSENDVSDKLSIPDGGSTSTPSTTSNLDSEAIRIKLEEAKAVQNTGLQEESTILSNVKDLATKQDPEKDQHIKTLENSIDSQVDRSQFVHYEGDLAVYTDPQSRQQYTWNEEKNEWKLRQIDYEFDGTNYFYTDKLGSKFKWDTKSNSWVNQSIPSVPLVPSETMVDSDDEEEYDENNARKTAPPIQRQDMSKGAYGYEGDTHTYTDATDGTVYLWDKEKNAWFPKVDDDFLARYQMSYGFIDQSSIDTDKKSSEDIKKEENKESIPADDEDSNPTEDKALPGQKRKPEPPKWFNVGEESTKVYVSNLPLDLTQAEFVDLMQKCGLVMKELDTNQMKVKLYTDPYTKQFKGDALCTYIKRESVDLALNILDGHEIRGKKIKVERAKFTMKGEAYDPKLKPKKKRKKDLEKLKKAQEKLFDWRPDKLRGERGKNESVIVVKNLFDPALFDKDVTLILEYQQDMREECSKCGHVKKVVIHDKHPEGVAQIFFKETEAADACKELLNGRWFGQRQITADTWDGKTRYKVQETPEEREARLKKWETFLEEEDRKKKESENKADNKSEESIMQSKESVTQSIGEESILKDELESLTEKSAGKMDVEETIEDSISNEREGDGNSISNEKEGDGDSISNEREEDGDSNATRSSGDSEGEG